MKKKLSALFALLSILLIATLAGCSSKKSASSNQTLTMVFYPNESAKDFNASRTAIKQQLKKATGKKLRFKQPLITTLRLKPSLLAKPN